LFFFFFTFCFFLHISNANCQERHIYVKDADDEKIGLKSSIYTINRSGKKEFVTETNERGYQKTILDCKTGMRVRIEPNSDNYYPDTELCPSNEIQLLIFRLTRVIIINNLEANADLFEKTNDYATAAMIVNELHARQKHIAEIAVDHAVNEVRIYTLFGKHLGVKDATEYDPEQGKSVISRSLKEKIKEFQASKNINATGKLDYMTLRAAAGNDVGVFMYRDFEAGDRAI
jgi:hypothetical protein